MTAEYRTHPETPFASIDHRLERHGIQVRDDGGVFALVGSKGMLFVRSDQGYAHFERHLGVDVDDILECIEVEYGVSIVDEDDRRFWGYPIVGPPLPMSVVPPSWILIEGPPRADPRSACLWVEAVRAVDAELPARFEQFVAPMSSAAMALLCRWIEHDGVIGVNLRYSVHAEAIVLMVKAGLLKRVGLRYRMITSEATVASGGQMIVEGLAECEQPLMNSDGPLMSREEMEALACQLRRDRNQVPDRPGMAAAIWRQEQENHYPSASSVADAVVVSSADKAQNTAVTANDASTDQKSENSHPSPLLTIMNVTPAAAKSLP